MPQPLDGVSAVSDLKIRQDAEAYGHLCESWIEVKTILGLSGASDRQVIQAVRALANPSPVHPETLEHEGKTYRLIENGATGDWNPFEDRQEGDVVRMISGRLRIIRSEDLFGSADSFLQGALNGGAALYREVKPRVWEWTAAQGQGFMVNTPNELIDEFARKNIAVKFTATEVLP